MEKKMTKIQALQLSIEKVSSLGDPENAELVEKLELMLAQEQKVVAKKKEKKTVSKTAQEKEKNAQKVIDFFETQADEKEKYTLAELAIAIGLENATPQKMSPVMKLVTEIYELEVDKKDKKIAYKKLVAEA